MRRLPIILLTIISLGMTFAARAAESRIIKVLPHYLDLKGRASLLPGLYDRDAYQAQLRQHPEQRSALRFDVLWRGKSDTGATLKLRIELRGSVKGELPGQKVLETEVKPVASNHWTALTLGGEDYKKFGEVSAWRATLWDGERQIGEQKSFLW